MNKVFHKSFLKYFLIVFLLLGILYLSVYHNRESLLAIYIDGESTQYTREEMDNAHNVIQTYFDKANNKEKINEIIYLGDLKSKQVAEQYHYKNAALFIVGFEENNLKSSKTDDNDYQILLYQNELNKWVIDEQSIKKYIW